MRVLITNNTLAERSGTELYVRDLAIELLRRGHQPVAYSTKLGKVADELRNATVPVISTLQSLAQAPDIIHGHHHYETLAAIMNFPGTPAIYYCHGWLPFEESPFSSPNILRYVAVDDLCRERLVAEGAIPTERIVTIYNFFDQARFQRRPPLPAIPKRALALNNDFSMGNDLTVLREACERFGIELEAAGLGLSAPEANPGERMAAYDVVFAKARTAIEAMAVGASVVLCSPGRLGGMVTSSNFPSLRPLNFGIRTLSRPLTTETVADELACYDPVDAEAVSAMAREQCRLAPAVDRILELYSEVLHESATHPPAPSAEAQKSVSLYLEKFATRYKLPELNAELARAVRRYNAAEEKLRRAEERLSASEQERERLLEQNSEDAAKIAHWRLEEIALRHQLREFESQTSPRTE